MEGGHKDTLDSLNQSVKQANSARKKIKWVLGSVGISGTVFLLLAVLFVILMGAMTLEEDKPTSTIGISQIGEGEIPKDYIPIYQEAADKYGVQWTLIAAIHKVETNFGTHDTMVSSVGALGHFQFMPQTWVGWGYPGVPAGDDILDTDLIKRYGGYGVDADLDGKADPYNIHDAAYSCAKYLKASGAPGDLQSAVFAYNHAQWYVDKVLALYESYTEGNYTEGGTGTEFAGDNETIETALELGMTIVGKSPYNFGGGRNPTDIANKSFDCSSFIHWMYANAGITLGNYTSVTTWTLLGLGQTIDSYSDIQRGDIIFFDTYAINGHVGVYLGGGKFINDQSSHGVWIDDMNDSYWKAAFNGNIRRVVTGN